jgi:hypothetical protein
MRPVQPTRDTTMTSVAASHHRWGGGEGICTPSFLRARKDRPTAVRTSVSAGRSGPSGVKLGVLREHGRVDSLRAGLSTWLFWIHEPAGPISARHLSGASAPQAGPSRRSPGSVDGSRPNEVRSPRSGGSEEENERTPRRRRQSTSISRPTNIG